MTHKTKASAGALTTRGVPIPDGFSLCAQCGTWRKTICGEGCTWGVTKDCVNGGFRSSVDVLEWYYKYWQRLVAGRNNPDAPCEGVAVAIREAVGWRPIETAPKDGTQILIDFGYRVGIRQVAFEESVSGIMIWCVDDNKHGPYALPGWNDEDIRGWMPLPRAALATTGEQP